MSELFFFFTLVLLSAAIGSGAWFAGWPTWLEDMGYERLHAGWYLAIGFIWMALAIFAFAPRNL